MTNIRSVLESIGYKLTPDGSNFFRAKPIYRNSDNNSSLRISAEHGGFTDFSENISGNFYQLVQLSLNLKDLQSAKTWLKEKGVNISADNLDKPILQTSKMYYPVSILDRLIKNNSYWNDRGISDFILEKYKGGVAISGSLANRYVFPIFDRNSRIIGFIGRDLTNISSAKYKIIGPKKDFIWPYHIFNLEKGQPIILVESPGCVLKLSEVGINTSICMFGVSLSDSIISFLNSVCPSKILISTNNEVDNNSVGNNAALKIQERLLQFFNPDKIKIALPTKKDFGCMTNEEILEWKANN